MKVRLAPGLGRDRLGNWVINPSVDRLRHHDRHYLGLVEGVLRPDLFHLRPDPGGIGKAVARRAPTAI